MSFGDTEGSTPPQVDEKYTVTAWNNEGEYFVPPDEPFFFGRGKDLLMVEVVQFYARRCRELARSVATDEKAHAHYLEHADSSERLAARIKKWQDENKEKVGIGCTTLRPEGI